MGCFEKFAFAYENLKWTFYCRYYTRLIGFENLMWITALKSLLKESRLDWVFNLKRERERERHEATWGCMFKLDDIGLSQL